MKAFLLHLIEGLIGAALIGGPMFYYFIWMMKP
jgi:hypothetical protein